MKSISVYSTLRRHWLVACTAAELKRRPLSRVVLGLPIVLFRSGIEIGALIDRCPHRNVPLSAGRLVGTRLQCPYHGWQFDIDGTCRSRPGAEEGSPDSCDAAQSIAVCEQEGLVWVCLDPGEAQASPPQSTWHDDRQFAHFTWVDSISAEFVDAFENLLDGTHTPFVHAGLLRTASAPQTFTATVRVCETYVEAEYADEGKQNGWVSRLFERDRAASFGRFRPPCLAELEYRSRHGTEFVLNSYFTPEQAGELRIYSRIFLRRDRIPFWVKRILLTPFFRKVVRQDADILRLQQENIARFGERDYRYWEGDLLRGWIDSWLRDEQFPSPGPPEQEVRFQL